MDTQVIDLLKPDINLEYLFYFLCMQGGSDSLDYLNHHITALLMRIPELKLDYSLYSPSNQSLKTLLENTKDSFKFYDAKQKKVIAEFEKSLEANHKLSEPFDRLKEKPSDLLINYYKRTLNLRGFTQKINYHRIYHGNIAGNGRVPDYIIDDKDVAALIELIDSNKDIKKTINLYMQTFQQNHPNKVFAFNTTAILYDIAKLCYEDKQKKCIPKSKANTISNLFTSLLYSGDSREHALLFCLILEVVNYIEFINLKEKDNKKIEKVIRNNYRIMNLDMYLNSHFEKIEEYKTILPTYKPIKATDQLNPYEKDRMIKQNGQIYIATESHSTVGLFLSESKNSLKVELYDAYYTKNKLNKIYQPKFILDDTKVNFEMNDDMIYFGDKQMFGKLIYTMFKPSIDLKHKYNKKMLYLNKTQEIPGYFKETDSFIETRENYLDSIKQKYFKRSYPLFKYTKDYKGNKVMYYLTEHL